MQSVYNFIVIWMISLLGVTYERKTNQIKSKSNSFNLLTLVLEWPVGSDPIQFNF